MIVYKGRLKRPTGCGSVWLERRLREAEVASSNLVTPIFYKAEFLQYEKYGRL